MALRATLDFLKTEAGPGAALTLAGAAGFILANSPWAQIYFGVIDADFTVQLGGFVETLALKDWIRQGLMAAFFFVMGLEIKQEVLKGELSSPHKLGLPVLAAAGGFVAAMGVYLAFNLNGAGAPGGWPISTPTDSAIGLAVLALMGRNLPKALRVFLLAVAVASQIAAMGVIAVLYTHPIHAWTLLGAGLTLIGLVALSEWKDAPFLFRIAGFLVLGGFALKSGIDTALAGLAGALTVPSAPRRPGQEPVLRHFRRSLEPYVAFVVLPLFALTSLGVSLSDLAPQRLLEPAVLGVAAALAIGKPAGIMTAVWLAVRSGLARRPTGATWLEILGVAALAGSGFTLSLYLADLSTPGGPTEAGAVRLAAAAASMASAGFGAALLGLAAGARQRRRASDLDDGL